LFLLGGKNYANVSPHLLKCFLTNLYFNLPLNEK
jgi:hypothetical protein